MLSVAREGPNERCGVDGRASLPTGTARALLVSRARILASALVSGIVRDAPSAANTAGYRSGAMLR